MELRARPDPVSASAGPGHQRQSHQPAMIASALFTFLPLVLIKISTFSHIFPLPDPFSSASAFLFHFCIISSVSLFRTCLLLCLSGSLFTLRSQISSWKTFVQISSQVPARSWPSASAEINCFSLTELVIYSSAQNNLFSPVQICFCMRNGFCFG